MPDASALSTANIQKLALDFLARVGIENVGGVDMEELKDALLEIAKAINRRTDIERDKAIIEAAHWEMEMLSKRGDYSRLISVGEKLEKAVMFSEIKYD